VTGDHRYLVLFNSSSYLHGDAFRPVTVSVPGSVLKVASNLQLKAPKHLNATAKAKKVKITARLTMPGPAATGQVVFKVGKTTLTGTLVNGVATIKVKITKTTKVNATYIGDANTLASSATAKIKVTTKPTR
jgi:hypothetical protein